MKTAISTIGRKYGYRRGLKIAPRVRFAARMGAAPASLPPSVDLRDTPFMPPVYDQGQLGSCTANAIASAIQFIVRKQGLPDIMPSRLFIYYNERAMEGTVDQDAGAIGGDGIDSTETLGIASESLWPYDISKFAVKPTPDVYAAALGLKTATKEVLNPQLNGLQEVKYALSQKIPVPFGMTLFRSFESTFTAQDGVYEPSYSEAVVGGHETKLVGYDDNYRFPSGTKGCFIVKNSWGESWGELGYYRVPYQVVLDCGSDFEAVTSIQTNP
jgi:C1A family cysteine protease